MFVTILLGQGRYADAFQELGSTPRVTSLGQAVVAFPEYPGAYLVNPATMAFLRDNVFQGTYINQFGLADFLSLHFIQALGDTWNWGIHSQTSFVASIPKRPFLGNIRDLGARRDSIRALTARGFKTFSDLEGSLTFTLTRNYHVLWDPGWRFAPLEVKLPVGLNVNYLHKRLYNLEANGVGFDLGGLIQLDLGELIVSEYVGDLRLGMALNDVLGTRLYWTSGRVEVVPTELVTGFSYVQPLWVIPLTVTAYTQFHSTTFHSNRFGFELNYRDLMLVQMGFKDEFIQGGVGFTFPFKGRQASLEYSFSPHDLGNIHRLGLGIQ
jgi:hypothetical protein